MTAKLSSTRLYSGKVLNLDLDRVRFPDGSEGELEIVRHSGASAILPFLSDPTGDDPVIMLIKQYRYAAEGFIYEIPAGRLDDGEDPAECARRELMEETGCTATHLEHLYTFYTTPGFIDEQIHLYLASGLEQKEHAREHDEFMSVETMPLSKALELIRAGEIRDGKTTVGILFAAGFRAGL